MTPAISYRRVSTESQLDGYGLDIQDDAIAALATAEGFTIAATFADEGISGSEDLATRIGLADAIDYLAAHPGTVLIIPKLDRLARDMVIQEQVLAECWRAGGQVVSCLPAERIYCQPDDPMDPSRTLIRQILGAVAQYDRAMIRARLISGRRRKLNATGYAGGPEPYGYTCTTERALLDYVTEQRRVRRPWRELAAELNAAGRHKRNGGLWSASELHRTMQRSAHRTRGLEIAQLLR